MLRLSALSLAVAGAMGVAHTANAEGVDVSGSVGVANMYLWRGNDLGTGDAAVSGDLKVSAAGFYGGVWGSSGDSLYGTEYDLYVGYGAEFGGVTIDLSAWNYMYPSSSFDADEDGIEDPNIADDFGGLSDAVLSIGFAGFTASVYDNIAGGSGYEYYTLSYSFDAFSVLVGKHDNVTGADEDQMVHVNLSYAYNDNLSFTFSQQVDQEIDDDLKFVVAYSLPIGD
ncbi:MAG: histidine kinase [Gammaproteobacteria bacterium]|nr:histidine kinase [Gammaproteobacteria bacterium]